MDHTPEPTPNCPGHGLPARLWWTKKQPPRQFYKCPKPIGEQCNFFAWFTPSDSIVPQTNAIPPTPDSARPADRTIPEPPSTPTPAPRNKSVANGSLQRNAFHLDAASGSGNTGGPRTPPGPEYSDNPNNGLRSPIGLATQPHAIPLHDDMEVPCNSQILRDDNVQEPSSDVVSAMIHQLGRTLPEYLKKLERQKLAADRSREAKSMMVINLQDKVNRLEAEVARLKSREQELEKVVATFEN